MFTATLCRSRRLLLGSSCSCRSHPRYDRHAKECRQHAPRHSAVPRERRRSSSIHSTPQHCSLRKRSSLTYGTPQPTAGFALSPSFTFADEYTGSEVLPRGTSPPQSFSLAAPSERPTGWERSGEGGRGAPNGSRGHSRHLDPSHVHDVRGECTSRPSNDRPPMSLAPNGVVASAPVLARKRTCVPARCALRPGVLARL